MSRRLEGEQPGQTTGRVSPIQITNDEEVIVGKDEAGASSPWIPQVPMVQYPGRYAYTVQHWGFFDTAEIASHADRLLMLDIDFGRQCSLHCPTCFRRHNAVDDTVDPDLTYDELVGVLGQARDLGLKAVKICGAGEPLENPDLLRLTRTLTSWDVGLSIFTKGHVLGDDEMVARIFAGEKILTARSLAEHLFTLKTSVLLGFQSLRPKIQDRLVGNLPGYTRLRNRALELLAGVGFNKCSPTRLACCALPITRDNYDELFSIYVFCQERNIMPLIAALMVSGKQLSGRFLQCVDVSDEDKIRLYTQIYAYNIDQGFQSLDGIRDEGISPMPGIHPCNQIAVGLYLTSNGNIIRCPGDGDKPLGNVRTETIGAIWERHRAWMFSGRFNCGCPYKDGRTLPSHIYERVMSRLSARQAAEASVRHHTLVRSCRET